MPASSVIGNIAVNLTMETAAFQSGATIAEKRMAAMGTRFEKLGAKITQAGTILTAGITLPLAAFGKKAFDAAKDAAELDSAFTQTFGKMAKEMDAWAVATGNAMGRSTREIKEGANAFGLYFNQASRTREEAAKMSQQFTVLAQDLASFHNTGVDEALTALRSGLSGETEPMRRFGVFLNEAAVKAKAAELGFRGVNGALTDQQKIMARAALILEQTKNAQGDVARTSGSTANQIRASQAAWEELQITVGTKLLPVLTPLITALTNVLEKFNQLSPTTQTWIVGLGALAAALGPVMIGLGPLIIAFGKLLPLLTGLVPVVASLGRAILALAVAGGPLTVAALAVGAVYLAFKNWEQIKAIVQNMVSGVASALRSLISGPLENAKRRINEVTETFRNMYEAVVGHSYVPDMVEGIAREFAQLARIMVDPAVAATDKVAAAFQTLKSAISQILGPKAGGIFDMIMGFVDILGPVIGKGLFGGGYNGGIGAGTSAGDWGHLATGIYPDLGFARGGAGIFGGRAGIDRNVLSLNGRPIARVSRGEHFQVTPANAAVAGGRVVIELRSDMLEARIAEGANVQIMRTHGALRADTLRAQQDRARRAPR